ncbi:hypothetical protein HPB50_008972 [Hyalomma asiaticum]|uniref:Uncharacterized protein n=1 Tax=Hyalomma asiaticum TaxID=266040 RepID=A0ACB7RYX5_HYAAI|nr:hypothetical protein HPB50_008972 [Hyalomma asiaticum]
MYIPVQVTTLPDLSASLPTYSGDGSISASHWIEELERTRNLASWEPSTLLAVALGKLRGAAADWKAVIGPHGENLVNYSLAKLKLISGRPVTLTDTQSIEYALQDIADVNLATTIAAQRPETVAAYMDIVTLSHSSRRLPHPVHSSAKLSMPSPQAPRHIEERMNVQAVSDKTRAPQRISALPVDQQEARYLTISARHGAPAYRPSQNLAEAVCFQCRQKGHLASKCPSRATAPPSTTHPSPALHSTLSETLEMDRWSSQVDAFPDSGSKVTLVSRHLVSSLPLLPWTRPPLVVVGGTTVAPAGAICLKISVGPITGLVEAAALDNNAVPLILGEDWFPASHAQFVFQPPMPTEIRHSTTGTSVRCHERLLPGMSNAVMIKGSSFNCHVPGHHSSGGLQRMLLPGPDEPPWLALSCQDDVSTTNHPSFECKQAASPTTEACIDPSLPSAQIGSHMPAHKQWEIRSILSKHAEVFAREEGDLGLYEGVEHSIHLLPDAVPYNRLLTLSQNRATAASNTEEAQGKRKTAYDKSHRDHSFQVGQFVWVRRQDPVTDGTGKLAPKFKGIYPITDQKTPVTFLVSRVTGQGPRDRLQNRVVHVSQLKHYVPPYVEPYIVQTQELPLCDPSGSPSVGDELSQPPVSIGPAVLPPAVPSSRPHHQRRPPERLKDYSLSQ